MVLVSVTLPFTLLSVVVGVVNNQSTGNVWVTHEEMESLAATPPTVSLPPIGSALVTSKAVTVWLLSVCE